MRGGRQPAKPDVGRPLDGRVRRRRAPHSCHAFQAASHCAAATALSFLTWAHGNVVVREPARMLGCCAATARVTSARACSPVSRKHWYRYALSIQRTSTKKSFGPTRIFSGGGIGKKPTCLDDALTWIFACAVPSWLIATMS